MWSVRASFDVVLAGWALIGSAASTGTTAATGPDAAATGPKPAVGRVPPSIGHLSVMTRC